MPIRDWLLNCALSPSAGSGPTLTGLILGFAVRATRSVIKAGTHAILWRAVAAFEQGV